MRKRIVWQAGLAGLTVVLTVVIIFAMTAAWYTNIVQSSGLMFEAEAWGFDGTIEVNTDPIEAGPGDDGVIHLAVHNDNENTTAVSVGVSKARMATEMQKRLYFYVDTQLTRNGETMERVYLNSQESYSYILFNKGSLTLTETIHNGAQLRWQWVYDVLGYYVLGTAMDNKLMISEYLRPIEYDYDRATIVTSIDETTGQVTMDVETVDGVMSLEDYLVELSGKDGYPGRIDPALKTESGYYPVAVDPETGYGVYAYMLSYTEIEMETQFDTRLGKAVAEAANPENGEPVEPIRYEAQLTISAQKNKNNVINADSLASLQTAINFGASDVIQLSGNIVLTGDEIIEIGQSQKIMLDLNGYVIRGDASGSIFKVNEGGSLTLTNGILEGNGKSRCYAVHTIGGELVMSGVTAMGFEDVLRIGDCDGSNGLDSKVRLYQCQLEASSYGILVKGNGIASDRYTQLILEECVIKANDVCVGGNGNDTESGTDIQIINSTLIGNESTRSVGIFHPQQKGNLTIQGGSVTAYTAIAIKGGNVSVNGATVKGVGLRQKPIASGSGCSDTGDGIYIETNYGYPIFLQIDGDSKIESVYGYSLQVFEPDAPNVTVQIYSGIFKEPQPEEYVAAGSEQIDATIRKKNTEGDSSAQ